MAASRERMLPNGQFINETGDHVRQTQAPGGPHVDEFVSVVRLSSQAQTPGGAYAIYTK